MTMRAEINIAEFKRRMGHHLKRVRAGQTLTLLDRDRPVARITAVEPEGGVRVIPPAATGAGFRAPPRVRVGVGGSILDALQADRDER